MKNYKDDFSSFLDQLQDKMAERGLTKEISVDISNHEASPNQRLFSIMKKSTLQAKSNNLTPG